jgi:small GTP-binding protein
MGIFSIFKRKKLKGNIAFVGLGYAGKTTILNRLKSNNFSDETIRTMGLNVDSFEYQGVNFSAFDLGGQETFRLIWAPYVSKTIAVCYVIDSSTPELFEESAQVLKSVLEYIPENAILLILANKSDLAGPNTLQNIIHILDFFNLQKESKLARINIFFVSAKTGDQFSDAFEWLAENVTEYLKNSDKMNKLSKSKNKTEQELKESLGL